MAIDGETLLFLPGLGAGVDPWAAQLGALPDGFVGLAPDIPGLDQAATPGGFTFAGAALALRGPARRARRRTGARLRPVARRDDGSRDVANLAPARELAATIPNAELQIIPRAGHPWNVQFPELFSRTIADFYARPPTRD